MKKTVTTFKVENVSIETTRGRKAIVSELLKTKKTLSQEDYKSLKQLQTAQRNLAKLKTKRRQSKSYYAKKSLNEQIKKREKYVEKKFNKVFGVKFNKKTGKFAQTQAGKTVARFTQRGTYQIQAKKKVDLTTYMKERQTDGLITTYEEFLTEYLNSRDIRDTLQEYGVYARYNSFVGGTSAGWTRRVMDACGVSDTVTDTEFYEWLDNVASSGNM